MIRKCLFPPPVTARGSCRHQGDAKEVMPILNKPLIEYGVEEALAAGMHYIAIVTGRGKRALEDHFDISYELEHQISGNGQGKVSRGHPPPHQRVHLLLHAPDRDEGPGPRHSHRRDPDRPEPFGVVLADDLCVGDRDPVLAQMAQIYRKYRCSVVAIEQVPHEEVDKYGIIAGAPLEEGIFVVSDMVEKPSPDEAPSNLAIIGRYILTPDIFDILRRTPPGKNGELQITDALKTQAAEGMVLAYRFKGRRFDCGGVDGFVEATNYFYQRYKATAE